MTGSELRKQAMQKHTVSDPDFRPADLTCVECNTVYKVGTLAVICAGLDVKIAEEKAQQ